MMKKLIVILALFLTCVVSNAQPVIAAPSIETLFTNYPVGYSPQKGIPPNIKADLIKLFSDILDSVNFGSVTGTAFLAWASARFLRKGLPDTLQTGIIGTILKHAALEINPQLQPTPPNVPDAKVILVGQETGEKVQPELANETIKKTVIVRAIEPPTSLPVQ